MKVKEFVAMQNVYAAKPTVFDISQYDYHGNEIRSRYTIENYGEFENEEVSGWYIDNGVMVLEI